VIGSSRRVDNSVARVTLGPCAYDVSHWHPAWEVITPISPTNAITSILQEPSPASSTHKTVVQPGQSFAIPTGWLHVDFNDNCSPTDVVFVWNAVNTGGTFPVPQDLFALGPEYNNVAFTAPLPPAAGLWVVDETCAARCGLSNTTMTKGKVLKQELASAANAALLIGRSDKQTAVDSVKQVESGVGAQIAALGK